MDIMTHAKFYFNRLMLTLIFAIWASEPPPRAWRTTEKAGPDRVKNMFLKSRKYFSISFEAFAMLICAGLVIS